MAIEIPIITSSLSIIISILGTLGIVWKASQWLNKQADEKVEKKKKDEEEKARGLREHTDKKAEELKEYTDRKANELKEYTIKMAETLKTSNENINKEMLVIMKDMDQKLTTRANLTNGNVSNIRKDLLELSQDIEDLYYYNDTHSNNGSITLPVNRRRTAKKRKRRLDQINMDRKSQEHPEVYDRRDVGYDLGND
jgi:hypothetical protein